MFKLALRYLKDHKQIAAAIIVLIIAFVAFSIVQFNFNIIQAPSDAIREEQGLDPTTDASSESSLPEEGSEEEGSVAEGSETTSTESDMSVAIPADIAKKQAAYSDAQQAVLDRLCASVWTNDAQDSSVSFTKETYVASTASDTQVPFAIGAVETLQTRSAEGVQTDETIFSIETSRKSYIAHIYVNQAPSDDGKKTITEVFLACELFGIGNLRAGEASNAVLVSGPSDDWFEANKTSKEKVEKALSAWCAKNVPTATRANWFETASFDYDKKVIRLQYTLDNNAKTMITITIKLEDGAISIKKG